MMTRCDQSKERRERAKSARSKGRVLALALMFSGISSGACGGVVEEEPLQEEPMSGAEERASEMPEAPSKASGELLLEECRGGSPSHSELCPWIDSGYELCFKSKEDACSCLCPLSGESICRSGFYDGEEGRVVVRCD